MAMLTSLSQTAFRVTTDSIHEVPGSLDWSICHANRAITKHDFFYSRNVVAHALTIFMSSYLPTDIQNACSINQSKWLVWSRIKFWSSKGRQWIGVLRKSGFEAVGSSTIASSEGEINAIKISQDVILDLAKYYVSHRWYEISRHFVKCFGIAFLFVSKVLPDQWNRALNILRHDNIDATSWGEIRNRIFPLCYTSFSDVI